MTRNGARDAVSTELAVYRAAQDDLEWARAYLHDAIRRALRAGHTAYQLAAATGISERHIGRIGHANDEGGRP